MATFEDVRRLAAELPEVTETTSYGTPAMAVRKKSFCRLWGEREHRRDGVDDSEVLVVFCDADEKGALIDASGGVLFSTPHYEGYGAMLIRLADVRSRRPRRLPRGQLPPQGARHPAPRPRRPLKTARIRRRWPWQHVPAVTGGGRMLEAYRVVELSGRDGWLAGFLLAQLGAEVVLVEPPGGHPRDRWFEAYNRGKRSVIAAGAGRRSRRWRRARTSCSPPARQPEMAVLDDLAAADPTLVTVSVTPFGRRGPKADWLATDLTLVAASGQMAVTGDPDRPPVRTTLPQAWMHACCEAVVGALVALHGAGHAAAPASTSTARCRRRCSAPRCPPRSTRRPGCPPCGARVAGCSSAPCRSAGSTRPSTGTSSSACCSARWAAPSPDG